MTLKKKAQEKFVCTVGYLGREAIVDKRVFARLRRKSVRALMEKGHYKMALCRAIARENEEEALRVMKHYNEKSRSHYRSLEQLKRLFGVYAPPEGVRRFVFL